MADQDYEDIAEEKEEVDYEADDGTKVFVSRIPFDWDKDKLTRKFAKKFGAVQKAEILWDDDEDKSRGFGFVTFEEKEGMDKALEKGSLKARRKILQIRAVTRDEDREGRGRDIGTCFLWTRRLCNRGDKCKFLHEGPGACVPGKGEGKRKCFLFKKGKCKEGDKCAFRHDQVSAALTKQPAFDSSVPRDCSSWKKKGKCNKHTRGECKFTHSEEIQQKALAKKEKKMKEQANKGKKRSAEAAVDGKVASNRSAKRAKRQACQTSLTVRVHGFPYDTDADQLREFFKECGTITGLECPRWIDSGRSKGFCSMTFEKAEAVEKALVMHKQQMGGRWLDVTRWQGALLFGSKSGVKQKKASEIESK